MNRAERELDRKLGVYAEQFSFPSDSPFQILPSVVDFPGAGYSRDINKIQGVKKSGLCTI